jgi:hypothetical protein
VRELRPDWACRDKLSYQSLSAGAVVEIPTRNSRSTVMPGNLPRPNYDYDLSAAAEEALEVARLTPPGPAKVEALKKAGLLRRAADERGVVFARRGRPPK